MNPLLMIYIGISTLYGLIKGKKHLDKWIKDNPQYDPSTIFHWSIKLRYSAMYGIVFIVATLIYGLLMPAQIIEDIILRKKVL